MFPKSNFSEVHEKAVKNTDSAKSINLSRNMMEDVILSIIVPVYEVEKFIERCARSLFEQTILDRYRVEFIFVNDCTKDNSIHVLKKSDQ